jgi:hypothetical protein
MKTTKEQFLSHFIPTITEELKNKLPDSAILTKMLLKASEIISNYDVHVIQAIHKNMKEEDVC